jgi:glycosyltransferase involved in cell wall biosynthesis
MAGNAPYRLTYVIGELGKGGAEYQLYELLRGLDRTRFAPTVVALAADGYWAGPIRALDVPVREIAASGSADFGRLRRLRAELRALSPHVLHTVLWSGNSYGRLAAIGLSIPVVLTAERNVIARPSWQVMVERTLDRLTDRYLVNCRAIADGLVEREGLPREKMLVVHNGIDLSRLPPFVVDRRPARSALGFDPERRLVAQVGRLAPQKDYPTFLQAAARVAAEHADVDFLVVGEGALRASLEEQARTLGIAERVRFLGLRHDVPALLGAVDVFALTSLYEGLPNVVIEAMSAGAVAVATDVGGTADLVTSDETGILIQPRDPGAAAAAIGRLLREPGMCARMATAARRRIEDAFGMDTMVRRTSEIYLERLRAAGVVAAAA